MGADDKQHQKGSSYVRRPRAPNPPDPVNPNMETLREQWRYALRGFAKHYSQAWSLAILTGASLFAIGWYIKGENPLVQRDHSTPDESSPRHS